jgi:sugar lactone lactonase YvrE
MKRQNLSLAVLLAAGMAVALPGKYLLGSTASAQTPRALPTFEMEKDWPKVPPQWKVGDVSSFTTDAQGNIWLIHRPRTLKGEDLKKAAPPVMVFDVNGNFIKAWGGDGQGYEWPQREHGIYIDYKGFVWLGGNNCPSNNLANLKPVADDQLLKFTPDGKFVMQIGHSNQSKGNADTANLHRPADEQVYAPTNELFVADGYGNHRVIVFDADTGAFKRMWGAFANKPADDDHCEIVRKTNFDAPGPQQLSVVHSLRVANDGLVYVADRENRRVQMFTNDGKFIKQLIKPDTLFARSVAFSPDQEQQFLYVGDGDDIAILDRKTLEVLGSIKVPGMQGGGHLINTDAKGNIYIANTGKGMQKLAFKGMSAATAAK